MRAMTLWQPFASLIAEQVKTIETRPKASPWRSAVGETIAIHAAKNHDHYDEMLILGRQAGWRGPISWWDMNDGPLPTAAPGIDEVVVPLGAVVATARLVDVVPILMATDQLAEEPQRNCVVRWGETLTRYVDAEWDGIKSDDQIPFGDFTAGRYALLLDGIVALPEPVPARGYQGLWRLPEPVAREVDAQVLPV